MKGKLFGRFKDKKRLVLIIAAVAAVTAVLASAAFLMFSNKSPRSTYLEAESKSFKKYSGQLLKSYEAFYEEQKPYMDSRFKNRLEITADISSASQRPFGLENAQNIIQLIKKSKLIVDSGSSPENSSSLTNLSFLIDRTPIIDVSAYTKDNQLALSVPVLFPGRYFTVGIDKLDNLYDMLQKRYGIPDFRPKRITRKTDVARVLKLGKEDVDKAAADCGALISGLIDEKDVSFGNSIKLKLDNKDIEGREINVVLGTEKTSVLIRELCERVAGSDLLLGLTYGNYTDIATLYNEAGLFKVFDLLEGLGVMELNDVLKDVLKGINVRKDVDGFRKKLLKLPDVIKPSEGLKVKLVVDKEGNILKRDVEFSYTRDNGGKEKLLLKSGTNSVKHDGFDTAFFGIETQKIGNAGISSSAAWDINANVVPTGRRDDRKGRFDASYRLGQEGREAYSAMLGTDLDISTDETTMKKNSITKYTLEFFDKGMKLSDKFNGEINVVSWSNSKLKTRNSGTTITINANLPSLDIKDSVLKFDIKREDKFDIEAFKAPQISSSSVTSLGDLADRDLDRLEMDIIRAFGSFYLKNKSLVDGLFGR